MFPVSQYFLGVLAPKNGLSFMTHIIYRFMMPCYSFFDCLISFQTTVGDILKVQLCPCLALHLIYICIFLNDKALCAKKGTLPNDSL